MAAKSHNFFKEGISLDYKVVWILFVTFLPLHQPALLINSIPAWFYLHENSRWRDCRLDLCPRVTRSVLGIHGRRYLRVLQLIIEHHLTWLYNVAKFGS